jgi:hypothetical protein
MTNRTGALRSADRGAHAGLHPCTHAQALHLPGRATGAAMEPLGR